MHLRVARAGRRVRTPGRVRPPAPDHRRAGHGHGAGCWPHSHGVGRPDQPRNRGQFAPDPRRRAQPTTSRVAAFAQAQPGAVLDRPDTGAVDRARALEAALATAAALNDRRLHLAVDHRLPFGVVRCVDCGQFAAEADPYHDCPFPKLAETVGETRARELAWAGFTTQADIDEWSHVIDQVGTHEAGLLREQGVDPSVFAVESAEMPLADRHRARVAEIASIQAEIAELRSTDASRSALDRRLPPEEFVEATRRWVAASDRIQELNGRLVDETVAFGHEVAADVDARYDLVVDRLLAGQVDDWVAVGVPRELGEQVVAAAREHGRMGDEAYMGLYDHPLVADSEHRLVLLRGAAETQGAISRARETATVEAVGALVPLGGHLPAEVTGGARNVFEHTVSILPTAWLEASAMDPVPLRVQLLQGFANRSGYSREKLDSRKSRMEFVPVTCRSDYAPKGMTDEQVAEWLRARHPTAYDPERFAEVGKLRGKKRWDAHRVRSIRDVTYDPEKGRIEYIAEAESRVVEYSYSMTATIRTGGALSSTVHEAGHHLENTVPGLQSIATLWRDRRTVGQSITPIDGDPNEVGYEGGFTSHYVGRVYAAGDTEVVSTGLEAVYEGAYGGLVGSRGERPDPDHRAFVLGLLTTFGQSSGGV